MQPTGEWLNQPGGLAERLYGMRKAAGLTGDRMAADLGWPRSKVSKLENGRQMPRPADIEAWAAECGQPGVVPGLLDLLAAAQAVHRQHRQLRSSRSHADLQRDVDRMVRQAARIRSFEVAVIPGLLQTSDYARCRAVEVARAYGAPEDGIGATVAAWMRRKEVLYDSSRQFEFVIAEAALWFRLAPEQVMAGQLDSLLNVPGLGNVRFGIIPFAAELPLTPLHGFLMADDTAYVETLVSDITPGDEESKAYGPIFDALMAEAVTGGEARRLIMSAAGRFRD